MDVFSSRHKCNVADDVVKSPHVVHAYIQPDTKASIADIIIEKRYDDLVNGTNEIICQVCIYHSSERSVTKPCTVNCASIIIAKRSPILQCCALPYLISSRIIERTACVRGWQFFL